MTDEEKQALLVLEANIQKMKKEDPEKYLMFLKDLNEFTESLNKDLEEAGI